MTLADWLTWLARAMMVGGCVGIYRTMMPVIRLNVIVHCITGYFPKEDEQARALYRHLRGKQIWDNARRSPGD